MNKRLLLIIIFLCFFGGAKAQPREISTEELVNRVIPEMTKPIVIDFYADWCVPCRRYKPIFNNFARRYGRRASFYRMDIEQNEELCEYLEIKSIPTTIIIYNKDGDYFQQVGILDEDDLLSGLRNAESRFDDENSYNDY